MGGDLFSQISRFFVQLCSINEIVGEGYINRSKKE
jgi:hypothetical protein